MEFEIIENKYYTQVYWTVPDKSKITFNDLLVLAEHDGKANGEDYLISPGFHCFHDQLIKYKKDIIKLMDSINNDKLISFRKESDDELFEVIESLLEDVYQCNFVKEEITKIEEIGCDQYSKGWFSEESTDRCGCKYTPDDFPKYHSRNDYDDSVSYSLYPMKYISYNINKNQQIKCASKV